MAPQVSGRPGRLLLRSSSASTMILYLLCTALILGVVESQTVNVTKKELSKVLLNQTFNNFTTDNSTMKLYNITSNEERGQVEEELQKNQTSVVIREDDENFQDQENEHSPRRCNRAPLAEYCDILCGAIFHTQMHSIGPDDWCVLEKIIRPYNNMTLCLEELSNLLGCYYPNPDIQDFFVYIHSLYFRNCSEQQQQLVDAPLSLVLVLTLVPVSIIPALVYLVAWKSKVQD